MKNLAPHIMRQRLLIEGFFTQQVNKQYIQDYLLNVAKQLGLQTYGDPIVFSPEGMGKAENQGFDAFIPLIDSGISLYVWTSENFLSVVLYTCKAFDAEKAVTYTKKFFAMSKLEQKSF